MADNHHGFSSMMGTFLEFVLVRGLWMFNGLLHVVLAVALVLASVMVVGEFFAEVYGAFRQLSSDPGGVNLVRGFLHALGVLFIVWILSALISAEVEYVRTGTFHVRVFLEVAMITLLRQLIIMPVQSAAGDVHLEKAADLWSYVIVLAAILIVAVAHRLVGNATTSSLLPVPDWKRARKDADTATATSVADDQR